MKRSLFVTLELLSIVLHSEALSIFGMNKAAMTAQQTFYKRTLPESCTSLSSRRGRELFASAMATKGLKSFFHLIEQFTTQSEPAYCGLSTLVMTLNAFSLDPLQKWKGPWRWYEDSMLSCCLDLEKVKKQGITMKEFVRQALCEGIHADLSLAQETSEHVFRKSVQEACVEDDQEDTDRLRSVLVVSYSRKILGQTGSGHFSPIAAYDKSTDMVLILDTARFKYGPHWVPLSLLFEAMLPHDPDTSTSRGYIMLRNLIDRTHDILPESLLFQSQLDQLEHRRNFKEYLRSIGRSPSWEETRDYWTKGGSQPNYVWKMVAPALLPLSQEEADRTQGVLALVDKLLSQFLDGSEDVVAGCGVDLCRPSCVRTVAIHHLQATFVIFLASQPPLTREEIVSRLDETDESVKHVHQLLTEAEVVQLAIKTSG